MKGTPAFSSYDTLINRGRGALSLLKLKFHGRKSGTHYSFRSKTSKGSTRLHRTSFFSRAFVRSQCTEIIKYPIKRCLYRPHEKTIFIPLQSKTAKRYSSLFDTQRQMIDVSYSSTQESVNGHYSSVRMMNGHLRNRETDSF